MSQQQHIKMQEFLRLFPNTVYTAIPEGGRIEGEVLHAKILNLELNKKGYGLFFSVNGFAEETRRQDHLTNINAIYCDIDYPHHKDKSEVESFKNDLIRELSSDFEVIPSAIVKTKNGLHVYWLLTEPVMMIDFVNDTERLKWLERWRAVEEKVIERYNADPQAKDTTRVLRIPNTLHLKDPNDPYLCELVFFSVENSYTLEQLEKGFSIIAPPDSWAVASSDHELTKEVKEKISFHYPKLSRPSYKRLLDLSQPLPEGTRNKSLLVIAAACKEGGWSKEKTLQYFSNFHGLPTREIQRTINSAYFHDYDFGFNNEILKLFVTPDERVKISEVTSQILSKQSKDYLSKERGKAKERFYYFEKEIAELYPYLKYKLGSNTFYNYVEDKGIYISYDEETINSLFLQEMDNAGLKEFRKISCVKDKIVCFKSLPGRTFTQKQENSNKNIINVQNGLFDISTFHLSSHTPDYISTTQIPIEYHSDAQCPLWNKFLEQVSGGDKEQVRLLKQICGYSLTADTEFQKAFILTGGGGNGKGTFTRMLARIVGEENTAYSKLDTLNRQFGLTAIIGKRLNIIDEVSENYFESDIIKQLISGEKMSADIKYQKLPVIFTPIAKLVLTCNLLPKINDTTQGLYRRLIIIPFNNHFEDPDTELENKLIEELPGILNDSIEALKDLRECGKFNETTVNVGMLNDFKAENSPVLEFLRAKFLPFNEQDVIEREKFKQEAGEMYQSYSDYCIKFGYKKKNFANFIKEIIQTHAIDFRKLTRVNDQKSGKIFIFGLKPLKTLQGDYKVAYAK